MKFEKILQYAMIGAYTEVKTMNEIANKFFNDGDICYSAEWQEGAKKAIADYEELKAMEKKHWERYQKKNCKPDPLIELIRKELQK